MARVGAVLAAIGVGCAIASAAGAQAVDDAFVAVGNVRLTGNLFANDGPAPVTLVEADRETALGGQVAVVSGGGFTYDPPVGKSGVTDFFFYTVSFNGATQANVGRVTIGLESRVWFVDNAGAAGDGRSFSPFATLAAAEAASSPGDFVFVRSGSGPYGDFRLKSNQTLVGQPAGLTVTTTAGPVVVAASSGAGRPILRSASVTVPALFLADGSTVRSIQVTSTPGVGVAAIGVAGSTLANVRIAGTGTEGLFLHHGSGTFAITGLELSGAVGEAISVRGGTATIQISGTVTHAGASEMLHVDETRGGILELLGGSFASTGTGSVLIESNGGQVRLDAAATLSASGATVGIEILAPMARVDLSGAQVVAATAQGVHFEGGSQPIVLDGLAISGGTSGIAILGRDYGGSFSAKNGNVTHSGGRVVDFERLSGTTDLSGTVLDNTAGVGLRVHDSSGTLRFGDVTVTGTTVDAVDLQDNPSATIEFAGFDVEADGGRGFYALSSGTVSSTGGDFSVRGRPVVEIEATRLALVFGDLVSDLSDAQGLRFFQIAPAASSFEAASVVVNLSAGSGLLIHDSLGSFTFCALSITTAGGPAGITAIGGSPTISTTCP